jgi:hypothetical protein
LHAATSVMYGVNVFLCLFFGWCQFASYIIANLLMNFNVVPLIKQILCYKPELFLTGFAKQYETRSGITHLQITGSIPVLVFLSNRGVSFQCHQAKLLTDVTPRREFVLEHPLRQPCPTRRPRYTFLAPSVSKAINSNFKTKNILECLSTVKYFHKISLKHGTVLDIP